MAVYTSLLSTLNGEINMDAWLKNWIDEWDEGYERLEAAKRDLQEKKQQARGTQHPNLFRRFFSKRTKPEA